jgi:hypothetical protein
MESPEGDVGDGVAEDRRSSRSLGAKSLNAAIWIASAALVGLLAWNAFAVYGPPWMRPQIACDESVRDLGRTPMDASVEHSFLLHNRGAVPLAIREVLASCGCVRVVDPVQPVTIEPNGSHAVRVEWTVDRAPPAGEETLRNHVYVFSNDPLTPMLTLTVLGTPET